MADCAPRLDILHLLYAERYGLKEMELSKKSVVKTRQSVSHVKWQKQNDTNDIYIGLQFLFVDRYFQMVMMMC